MNTDMNYNYLVNRALHSKVKRTKEGEIALAVLTAKTSIKIPTAILKNLKDTTKPLMERVKASISTLETIHAELTANNISHDPSY